jgi:hypothetical protein
MKHPTIRGRLRTAATCATLAALAACGGGAGNYTEDDGGITVGGTLRCAGRTNGVCVQSDTLATSNLHARMVVVADGQHAQAQAGFLDHDGDNFDVALRGDAVFVVDGGTRTQLGVPTQTNNAFVTDPYLADLATLPVAARSYRMELVRSTGTYTSTVTMPPAFTIAAPASAKFTDASLGFTLDVDASPDPAVSVQSYDCLDAAGNPSREAGNEFADTVHRVDATHYTFSIARFREHVDPGPNMPAIVSCKTVQLNVRTNVEGVVDPALAGDSRLIAYQTRSVSFALN